MPSTIIAFPRDRIAYHSQDCKIVITLGHARLEQVLEMILVTIRPQFPELSLKFSLLHNRLSIIALRQQDRFQQFDHSVKRAVQALR